MKKLHIGIFLMIVCTLFTASGQFFLKIGTTELSLNTILYNYPLFLGFFFYGMGALLLIVALKFGDLSILYPIISLTFVWVLLISHFMLKETIQVNQLFGVTSIILGVVFLTGGKK